MKKVVVVGGGISGLSAGSLLREKGYDVTIFEASNRLGGKILTTELSGIAIDAGPDAFLVREPEMKELCVSLGLADDLVAPQPRTAKIWVDGAMHSLPKNQFLGIPLDFDELDDLGLLTARGIDRARRDLILDNNSPIGDETVGSLIRRRLGDEVMDKLVGPLLGGINAGDPDKISLNTAVPILAKAAGGQASLVLSIQSYLRSLDRNPHDPVFLTCPDGLGRVVEALKERLEDNIVLNQQVQSLVPENGKWIVRGQDDVQADAVILSTPAYASASILNGHNPDVSKWLSKIDYASIAFTLLSFPTGSVQPFDGSGFLVAKSEGLLMTACTWSSSKWGHLENKEHTYLRVSTGRAGDDRAFSLSDDELVATLLKELAFTVGLTAEPSDCRIVRWPRSFPQYDLDHFHKVKHIQRLLQEEVSGVFVAGAAFNGLGLSACIRDGKSGAQAAINYLENNDTDDTNSGG